MNVTINYRFRIVLFILALIVIWQAITYLPWLQTLKKNNIDKGLATSRDVRPVFVTVFYEALCPDSKNFFVKQLLPAVLKAPRLINISLVPYGKAKTDETNNGSLLFSCQHGPIECLANKIHGCAITKISDSILLLKYISCMISDNMIPELIGEKCAKELVIDWKSILDCSNSEMGNILLKEFGVFTDALNPKLSFVPTVLLDGKPRNQAAILKNFFKQVCLMFNKLPEECISAYK